MWPLLISGDALKVERCDPGTLKTGEVAVLARADGALVSHLVSSTHPLVTVGFSGTVDPAGLIPLGRAIAVRRSRVTVALSAPRLVYGVYQAWGAARRLGAIELAVGVARATWASRIGAPLRRSLARRRVVRQLAAGDLAAFAVSLSHYETLPESTLRALLGDGVVTGVCRGRAVEGLVVLRADGSWCHGWLPRRLWHEGLEEAMVELAARAAAERGISPQRNEIHPSQSLRQVADMVKASR